MSDHASAGAACALYVLGALGHAEEVAFERHLARCAACRDECDRLGPTASGMGQLAADEVSRLPDGSD
jgi:anti-sigma factor RsiW